MQFSGFFDWIDEKEAQNPVRFWQWTYSSVFLIPLILGTILYISLGLLGYSTQLDDDTTRYLLSAFIQSLAAIIAIVVTLTLVAIQFTASVYSSRLIGVFKKSPAMWAMILAYVSAISLFGFLLISVASDQTISGIKTGTVFYSYFLFIALIVILIPYIRVTINLMNSEKIIDKILDDLNKNDFPDIKPKDDPFQSIFEVINNSASKGDMVTFSYGINKVTESFIQIIHNLDLKIDHDYFCFRFCDDILRTSFILFEKSEDKFLFEIITNLDKIIRHSIEDPYFIVFNRIPKLICGVGNKAIEKEYKSLYDHCVNVISDTFKDISILYNECEDEKFLSILEDLLNQLNEMAYTSMKKENSQLYFEILSKIKIDPKFNRKKKESTSKLIEILVKNLKKIVYLYMRSPECQKGKYFMVPIEKIASYINYYCPEDNVIKNILDSLRAIGKDSCRSYKLYEITSLAKSELFRIGIFLIKENNQECKEIPSQYVADLYFSCKGLGEKEKEFRDYGKDKIVQGSGEFVDKEEYNDLKNNTYQEMEYLSIDPPNPYDDEEYCKAESEYQQTLHYIP